MKMETTPLTKDLVRRPSLVQLYMRLGPASLDVMLYNPIEEHSLIVRPFDLPSDPADRLKALENTVYDNPLLLSDFKKTTITVESKTFNVAPTALASADRTRAIISAAMPDIDPDIEVIADDLSPLDATVLTAVPSATLNFLRRTFNNAPIVNSLAPLTRYFRSRMPGGNTVKMLVNIRPSSLDLMALSRDRLMLVNRFEYLTTADAVYYIMACVNNITPQPAEVLLSGDRTVREPLTTELRRFHPCVMPMIFPSEMFKAGDTAMTAPFDLVIMPLCE